MTSSIDRIKGQKREMILRHAQADDVRALAQVLTVLTGLATLWWMAVVSVDISRWLTALAMFLISLFTLRIFMLMHECGHGSLFRTQSLNRAFGFVLGVVTRGCRSTYGRSIITTITPTTAIGRSTAGLYTTPVGG